MPFFSSHAITARLASAVCMPSMTSPAPAFALFTARPSPPAFGSRADAPSIATLQALPFAGLCGSLRGGS